MNAFAGLLGVVIGFLLSQFGTSWREFLKGKEAKRLIADELNANIGVIAQKRQIVNKIINSLDQKRILPGESVSFMTKSYEFNVHAAYPYLSSLQRDSLHVIYERVNQADSFLSRFESEILKHLDLKLVGDPYEMFSHRMNDILESMKVIEDLSKKYLSGNPVDVYYRFQK